MEIKRVSEKIEYKDFSTMKNWGKERLKETYAGIKKINYELGSKVIDLLEEYDLGIISVLSDDDWCNRQGLLIPGEQNFKEYRVSIGQKAPWEDFWDEYCYDNGMEEHLHDFDKLPDDEKEKIEDIFSEQPAKEPHNDEMIFSVFLPKDVENLNKAAMSDASAYLKVLFDADLSDVTRGSCHSDMFGRNTDEVINFINRRHIIITNKNLKDVYTISYRLYKDSKAFSAFESNMGNEFRNFFNDWKKLL